MKKSKKRKLAVCLAVVLALAGTSTWVMWKGQYNSNGVSNYPIITIDYTNDKQYICDSSNYKVYTVELKEVLFETKDAQKINLHDALTTGKLTISDMTHVCKKQKQDNESKVYTGDNYQIVLTENECMIEPLS